MLSKASDRASEIAMHRSAAGGRRSRGPAEGQGVMRTVHPSPMSDNVPGTYCCQRNDLVPFAPAAFSYPSLLFAREPSYFGRYVTLTERDTRDRAARRHGGTAERGIPESADRRNRKLIENARSFETGHDQFRV